MKVFEKGKILGKINVFDILIVLVIILAATGVYYKFSKSNNLIFNKTDNMQVAFFAEDVADFAAKSVKEGDIVKDRTSGVVIGTVKKVEIGSDIYYAADAEGNMVKSSKEGYSSVKVTVTGKGVYSGKGVTFGNADFYINRSIDVFFGDAVLLVKMCSIDAIGE